MCCGGGFLKSALSFSLGRCFHALRGLGRDRTGNVAIVVALTLVPMLVAVGASFDYIRSYNVRQKMQSDLDAALIAAVKQINNTADTDALKAKVSDWFHAQVENSYTLGEIDIDTANHNITATASGTVPTTFMKIANIDTVPVSVGSAVKGPATSYLNVYIVIDTSPSMLLAATTSGQSTMYSGIKCQFACHTGDAHTVSNKTYANNYEYSTAKNIKLRADVAGDAVRDVLSLIDTSDSNHERIKVGLYSLGDTLTEVLTPTLSTDTARARLKDASYGLTSATSKAATYFDVSLATLKQKVGAGGDGTTSGTPLKLVLLLTDGVQSQREWVTDGVNKNRTSGAYWNKVAPLNPDWCGYLKNQSNTMAVLYTEYLPITTDWGYNATVGSTMASANWKNTWGGTMQSGVSTSITRRDYIPYALADCASSKSLFLSASSSTEITAGLSTLFTQYLSSVRLTQ
ncbi:MULTISPECIES: TadE/TadG family type IV pilus assembly protein [unclassified Rhizobium]|uniref:TadE/TadG family type IV pilus assembly protein n=1 Tax=unclassified Rhizobium TaxID=2613769 RepID=UPI0007F17738|nr:MULTISPECIES: TadE/TadG family type IV pilus assembly protein [unclassified Rhizobium]ANM14880.1 Flp pilus assembly Tad-like protein [Rhizobium sp. N324]ANM21268.1 Flp pilus assembly Tad-like protein [Rhizobium sp. N541]ANM27640.1 Flp pilus assembly Tad-like protein [Rhizobium sp. N941]OYC99983.1 Flp pilus assembly Tad-like protein [Rhizobium sp. N4311]